MAVSGIGSRTMAMLGSAARSAEGMPLLISESGMTLNAVLFDFTTPIAAEPVTLSAAPQLTLLEVGGPVRQATAFLTAEEFAKLPASGTISPWRLRLSQDTATWT
jgi:hypothetical protein